MVFFGGGMDNFVGGMIFFDGGMQSFDGGIKTTDLCDRPKLPFFALKGVIASTGCATYL